MTDWVSHPGMAGDPVEKQTLVGSADCPIRTGLVSTGENPPREYIMQIMKNGLILRMANLLATDAKLKETSTQCLEFYEVCFKKA